MPKGPPPGAGGLSSTPPGGAGLCAASRSLDLGKLEGFPTFFRVSTTVVVIPVYHRPSMVRPTTRRYQMHLDWTTPANVLGVAGFHALMA